jgi:hypothetical protein
VSPPEKAPIIERPEKSENHGQDHS